MNTTDRAIRSCTVDESGGLSPVPVSSIVGAALRRESARFWAQRAGAVRRFAHFADASHIAHVPMRARRSNTWGP